jgi:DNA polymerase III subunit delta'
MSWEHILGHDAIREQFATILRRGRLAHAYLFTGTDGIGKRTFAIELAKCLLCEAATEPFAACDRCASCRLVQANTHPDLLQCARPEGKMELVIDVIRELCANWSLKPSRGKRKIAILDDADDFNEESANAFLKTLEEPPSGSLLILLATSLDSQLSTIRSRCQHVHFSPLSVTALTAILQKFESHDPTRIEDLAPLAHGSAALALELMDDDVWRFRSSLQHCFSGGRVSSTHVLQECSQFVEAAGKEAPKQRARATIIIRILTDLLSKSLHLSLGITGIRVESAHRFVAENIRAERLVELIDHCLESELMLSRYMQASLVIEAMVDKLMRAFL